jgi:Integrase core domain
VPKYTKVEAKAPGERLFMDTTGPFAPTAGGSKYDVKIVDQFSRKTWCARVKQKSQLPGLLHGHLKLLKGRGTPVKYLRCDNAGEHGNELKRVCAEEGVILEMTAPNTPQQNGVVERKIVTDRNRAHDMMEAARLTDEAKILLRAEAEAMAEKLSNISCNSRSYLMPNELFGEESHLRPEHLVQFGRIGYVTIRKQIKKKPRKMKLSKKATICVAEHNQFKNQEELMMT